MPERTDNGVLAPARLPAGSENQVHRPVAALRAARGWCGRPWRGRSRGPAVPRRSRRHRSTRRSPGRRQDPPRRHRRAGRQLRFTRHHPGYSARAPMLAAAVLRDPAAASPSPVTGRCPLDSPPTASTASSTASKTPANASWSPSSPSTPSSPASSSSSRQPTSIAARAACARAGQDAWTTSSTSTNSPGAWPPHGNFTAFTAGRTAPTLTCSSTETPPSTTQARPSAPPPSNGALRPVHLLRHPLRPVGPPRQEAGPHRPVVQRQRSLPISDPRADASREPKHDGCRTGRVPLGSADADRHVRLSGAGWAAPGE